jgi:hypothetical protein
VSIGPAPACLAPQTVTIPASGGAGATVILPFTTSVAGDLVLNWSGATALGIGIFLTPGTPTSPGPIEGYLTSLPAASGSITFPYPPTDPTLPATCSAGSHYLSITSAEGASIAISLYGPGCAPGPGAGGGGVAAHDDLILVGAVGLAVLAGFVLVRPSGGQARRRRSRRR